MSRTLAASASARAGQSPPSSRSRWPYSLSWEPQPAALTTTASTSAASKVSMTCRANRTASGSRPACADSAPQQPCRRGATTSQPSLVSTLTVAAFTSGKKVPWTQPVSRPTVRRRVPVAGVRSGSAGAGPSLGASASIARSTAGSRRSSPTRASRPRSPEDW